MKSLIYIIGTGPMAIEYTKVLQAQKHSIIVIGRSEENALKFEKETGLKPWIGGIENYLNDNLIPNNAFVICATGTPDLMKIILIIMRSGIKNILVEKPGALSIEELLSNEKNLAQFEENIYIAYNRRFYSSVFELERLIIEDGGIDSMLFEFTEWADVIQQVQKSREVKYNWFFANSTHVIDLAFFICGTPSIWQSYSNAGKINWHKKSNFVGAGVTDKGVLFSYISNWESAGRWGIEIMTKNRRIYLKPLEKIKIQKKGSLLIEDHLFDDSKDLQYKPGLYLQLIAFLNGDKSRLLTMKEQIKRTKDIYSKMQ